MTTDAGTTAATDELPPASLAALKIAFDPMNKRFGAVATAFAAAAEHYRGEMAARDVDVADYAAVDPNAAKRARPGYADCGLGVVHRSGRHMIVRDHLRLQRMRLRSLLRAALRGKRDESEADLDGVVDDVGHGGDHRQDAPPPAFHLSVVTSPIVPTAPPRLGALV